MKRWMLSFLIVSATASAWAATSKTIKFDTRSKGEEKAIREWGIDATWAWTRNIEVSVENAGKEIDFVRVGFYMHEAYENDGDLSDDQISKLDHALECARIVDRRVPIMISPHNEEGIIDWYKNSDGSAHIERWYHVMQKTREHIEEKGHKVVYVEAFNEPDYGDWNMGNQDDLDKLSERLESWNVLRVGPSVMNCDGAESWYKEIDDNIDAGSTHTLYGSMDQFVDFIEEVKDGRKKFFCPESHSIVEAMAAADAGADYLAWWGPIDEARGNFMRACQGKRLAYAAVERNWSAACVYRAPDKTLHAFVGANERENGITTEFRFICINEDVTYYPDGDMKNGQFRKRGEVFEVLAKPPGGERSQWILIAPGRPR